MLKWIIAAQWILNPREIRCALCDIKLFMLVIVQCILYIISYYTKFKFFSLIFILDSSKLKVKIYLLIVY